MRTFAICLLALLLPAAHVHAQQAGWSRLNDTGITWSGHATNGNASDCDISHPTGQDCHYGRDVEALAGTLTKMGGSSANNGLPNGFDYSKVCNSGHLAGQGDCPATPSLGAGSTDWACTRDNLTGLVWEVKVNNASHLRHHGHIYTNNTNTSDIIPVYPTCNNTLTACNTESYVDAVNAAGLCGRTDWRMPTVKELESIVDFGQTSPAIDPDYFPNTQSSDVWSGSPHVYNSNGAWYVNFNDGGVYDGSLVRGNPLGVRLVRAGQ